MLQPKIMADQNPVLNHTLSLVPQFITGDYNKRPVFLEDREYGLALDALVKACSDILPISSDGKSVLLGQRKVEPQPDWWFIGGRAKPGDSTREAAARNIKRELGLDLPVDRFYVISNFSMVWQYRQQEPKENGTADISTVHCLELTKEEEESVVLDPKEYTSSKYFRLDEVLSGEFHPALKQAVKDLKKKRQLDNLCTAAQQMNAPVSNTDNDGDSEDDNGGSSDCLIAAALAFVNAHQEASVSQEVCKVRFVDNCTYEYVNIAEDKEIPVAKRYKS